MSIGKGIATVGIWGAVAFICILGKGNASEIAGFAALGTFFIWFLG